MKTDATIKQTLLHVPLARLKFGHERPGAGINARAPNGGVGIKELAFSLSRLGVIVPLVVQESPSGDDVDVYVADGNRRLEALRRLRHEGGVLKNDVLDMDAIPCVAGIGDGLELSLVANVDRLPLHPVDKCEAFAILVDQGAETADVAARFSIKPREVEQALAIRALAPEIRAAWRAGKIKAEVAQAFTIEPDQKRQAKVFAQLRKAGGLWDGEIRSQLVGDRGSWGKFVAFVGIETYEAAGGTVYRDLFRDRHSVSDLALLKRLADETMEAECARFVADGWKWAMAADDPAAKDRYAWGRSNVEDKPTREEKLRLKELNDIIKAIDEIDDSSPDDDERREAATDEVDRIERAITMRAFTPEQKKRAGCLLSVREDGSIRVDAGFIISAAKAARIEAAGGKGDEPSPADKKAAERARAKKANAGEVSKALDERLTVALRKATVAALKIEAGHFDKQNRALAAILAGLAADLIRPEEKWHRPIPDKAETAIREAIMPTIMVEQLRKAFDAKDYFASVPKANMLAVLREIGKETPGNVGKSLEKKPTAEVAKITTVHATEAGWLPVQLRGPWYEAAASKAKPKRRR